MSRPIARVSLLASLLVTTACTQPPAQVDLKGQNNYGQNGIGTSSPIMASSSSNTYAAAPVAPVSFAPTSQTIHTSSISSTDLAPLPGAKTHIAAAQPTAQPAVHPWTPKPVTQAGSFNIRPTKVKGSREQMVSEVKLSNDKPKDKAAAAPIISDNAYSPAAGKPASKVAAAATGSFMWPVASKTVLSSFGPKGGGKVNDGINIASAAGEPVWASADGEVVYVGNELQGYGNMVLIKHGNGKTTTYAHLNRYTVDKYDRVKQGDIIGYVGATGNVKEPQLHFAIRDGKDPVDPQKYLTRSVAGL